MQDGACHRPRGWRRSRNRWRCRWGCGFRAHALILARAGCTAQKAKNGHRVAIKAAPMTGGQEPPTLQGGAMFTKSGIRELHAATHESLDILLRHVGSVRSEERRVGKECRSRWS